MAKGRKQVWIIGIGFGGKRLVTRQESAALKLAKLYIGSHEALLAAEEYVKAGQIRKVEAVKPAAIRRAVADAEEERIAVLADEDPASSGMLTAIAGSLAEFHPVVFPGVPVSVYAAARMGVGSEDAVYADLRRGDMSLPALCRLYPKVFVRASSSMKEDLRFLMNSGMRDLPVRVLIHPAEEEERLFRGRLFELAMREIPEDAVYLFERPLAMAGSGTGMRAGDFEGGPEGALEDDVRALVLSRMQITPQDIVYVIGGGIGDTAIEAAAQALRGTVYAVEPDQKKLDLIRKNCARFAAAGNVRVISGEAPAALGHLPPADCVLVRGCPESVVDLIQIAMSRNPDVRITVLTHTMEKAGAAFRQMQEKGLRSELTYLTTSHGLQETGGVSLVPGSAAFIVSGRR